VTCGTPESFFNGDGLFAMRSPEGGTSESSKDINGEVSIPVFTTGKMTSVQICEDILASGNAYAVAIHKVLFCDPDLPLKADLVINASGFNPANDFYNKAKGLVNQIYFIGDAKMPKNIHDAY
jgi:2,4-dienoyl-CoA reductase-like NADH-dependent reductase (Old Yellow Enzyme family)